jgi:hypothetical protein
MKNMKMNKWTMGLAAAGVETLSSVAQAQEAAAAPEAVVDVSPTLSGYVSTGYKYANSASSGYFRSGDGRNAFSMDVVDLKISHEQGDKDTDTGYTVELWMGPAASSIGTGVDTDQNADGNQGGSIELMQANIDLRLGGIDLKIGQFGTIIGAETYDYSSNKFYTHSWGFAVEPTHHTGILATYRVDETIEILAGLANTTGPETNGSGAGNGSSKTWLASVSYTLPSGTGALAGTELYYGLVSGNATGVSGGDDEYHYASVKLPELVAKLGIKVVWDHVEYESQVADSNVLGLYFDYALNADTTLNVRYETGNINVEGASGADQALDTGNADNIQSFTIGVNHKIWENVISRIEYRNDTVDVVGSEDDAQSVVALNLIYSF